jgi:selenide,water dikinase
LLEPLLRGAVAKINEAGACLAGGHTIDDDTLKFGLSVSGFVRNDRAWANSGARAGDVLLLTKALGTGTLTSALKRRELADEFFPPLLASMKQLNRAPELLEGIPVHAATDITGFGLAGHSLQMARASGMRFEFRAGALPVLPGARECLEKGILNRAHKTNSDYVKDETSFAGLPDATRWLFMDPQTSGGLLLSVPEAQADQALQRLRGRFPATAVVGRVVPEAGPIRIAGI